MMTKHLITEYREKSGLTLEALGQRLSPPVDKSTVMRWEKYGIPVTRVPEIERVTGISRHDLRPDFFGSKQEAAE